MGRKVLPPFLELALQPSSPLPLSRAGESLKGRLRRVHGSALNVICRGEITAGELRNRIRDGRQGPDGLRYLLTDDSRDRLLRLEPVEP